MFTKTLLWAVFVGGLASHGAFAANANGSLIHPDAYRGIAADRKAYRLGDTLTILVLEAAQAESQAATGASSDFGVAASAHDGVGPRNVGVDISASDDGQGQTSRAGRLQAELTARVIGIESHGLLRIKGAQQIVINGEKQIITVEGLVRQDDIHTNNTVLSTRLSDATITFTGDGVVTESQKHGIIYRFLNWLGLI
ncbi:MAG TPA: flagellar basal body L-ring protein FlgH [Gammaproteobacteria bacterium]|nr:flagellar basal body L-ring protein FlgH [Gammaproteobacteria bacterium]